MTTQLIALMQKKRLDGIMNNFTGVNENSKHVKLQYCISKPLKYNADKCKTETSKKSNIKYSREIKFTFNGFIPSKNVKLNAGIS